MTYEFEQIKEAYIKLKSYIYHDNSDLLLRRKLVEFETNKTKDGGTMFYFGNQVPKPYQSGDFNDFFSEQKVLTIDDKLKLLTDSINNYHDNSEFIDYFLNQIDVNIFNKKITENIIDENFITNNRVFNKYEIEKVTTFIDAPIELHIISVLWILEYGIDLDNKLDDSCLGNRLLLNKEKTKVVQGSGLFKPYFKQYNKWRDNSVKTAQHLINENKSALFLNLDIKDYFHSVRIKVRDIYDGNIKHKHKLLQNAQNLKHIFSKINVAYTKIVADKYQIPYSFYHEIIDSDNNISEFVLPIGLLSSYVLANNYLKEFDERIIHKIKPAYYGRYVDDILMVIPNPKIDVYNDTKINELNFEFEKYREKYPNEVTFNERDLSVSQKYILHNFYPILKLIKTPEYLIEDTDNNEVKITIKLNGYKSLYCQSKKSFFYYFDHNESDLVIDKLKKELDERSSEFRDFPENEEVEKSFEDNAYHLLYDGSDNKITTLKEYKENRYGLTVYLANKIFSALRHEKKETKEECIQVIKFFRGLNCLKFHTLWERIFTYLLVNKQAEEYVEFYLHCIDEIRKIKSNENNNIEKIIQNSLLEYLDCSHELALALNPKFIAKVKNASLNFEFRINKLDSEMVLSWLNFKPTEPNSYWGRRFRESNLIRHHYCIHPLLTYTKASKNELIDLTSLKINFLDYDLDDYLVGNSPRLIKFWECSLVVAFLEIKNEYKSNHNVNTNIFGIITETKEQNDYVFGSDLKTKREVEISEENESFYISKSLDIYKKINKNHLPHYILEDKNLDEKYFKSIIRKNDSNLKINEITINSTKTFNEPEIAFANTEVSIDNIISSIRSNPNLDIERYNKLSSILKRVREEKSNILLFPENFIPINILSSIVRFSTENFILTVTGLEHITINKKCFNLIVTILPIEVDGFNDSIVIFRLKNHYSHSEEAIIDGNHLVVPKPSNYRIDIFNWNNIYFSPFYCFELANVYHRSLLLGKIDLLIGIEWNKDTNYFSNIVEAGSRDLHTYVAQVNTSQYGDTRLTQPTETTLKDILRLKGGTNDSILVAKINVKEIREFQRQKFSITHSKGNFKPLPPDYPTELVIQRIKNKSILRP